MGVDDVGDLVFGFAWGEGWSEYAADSDFEAVLGHGGGGGGGGGGGC